MKRICSSTEKFTKHVVGRMLLAAQGRGIYRQYSSESCKGTLANQVTLARRDLAQHFFEYRIASGLSLSGTVTQMPVYHPPRLHED